MHALPLTTRHPHKKNRTRGHATTDCCVQLTKEVKSVCFEMDFPRILQ